MRFIVCCALVFLCAGIASADILLETRGADGSVVVLKTTLILTYTVLA